MLAIQKSQEEEVAAAPPPPARGGALTEHLEEQFGSGLGERHEAQFVDAEQLVAGDLFLEAQQLLLVACFDQLVDQGLKVGRPSCVHRLFEMFEHDGFHRQL
jgi:hypothetical protein